MRSDRIRGRFASNGVLTVPLQIGKEEYRFMVDTGASYCVLREKNARLLGLKFDANRARRIITASKQPVLAHTAILPSLRIGGMTIQNLSVLLIDLQKELGVDGLLGMNFLRKFRFCIEPESATLVLRNLRKPVEKSVKREK